MGFIFHMSCLCCVIQSSYYVSRYMTVYFVWLFCRTVLFTISSDSIQNMLSTVAQNLKKKIQAIFCE